LKMTAFLPLLNGICSKLKMHVNPRAIRLVVVTDVTALVVITIVSDVTTVVVITIVVSVTVSSLP
jgi:hypothetical protein